MVRPALQHTAPAINTRRRAAVHSWGFSLIELLVVVAIIAILSSVLYASINGSRQKGRDAQRIADIKRIQIALTHYYDKFDRYPTAIGPVGSSELVTNGFLETLPTDPLNHAVYTYAAFVSTINAGTALCSSYHLGTDLEDGTHTALSTDGDSYVSYQGSAAVGGETLLAGQQLCFGSPPDFHGSDATKCNAADRGKACYDVRP